MISVTGSTTVSIVPVTGSSTGTIPESELASATSKLNVLSVRASGGFDFVFAKPIGAFFGLTLMVPVAEFGASFTGDLGENEARGHVDPGEDLKLALDHKKNSVAYEISLGTMLSF